MRTFHIYDVINFNIGDKPLVTEAQTVLFKDKAIDSPSTSIYFTNKFVVGYAMYEGSHETKVNKSGRAYDNSEFDMYIGKNSFRAYYKPDNNYIIFEGKGSVVKGALRKLQYFHPTEIEVKTGNVDFAYIKQNCDNIWGGWISHNDPRLKKVGLFGDHVDLTQDYNSHATLGSLSSICVELTCGNEKYNIMICRQRTVVFYQSNENVAEDLRRLEILIPLLYGVVEPQEIVIQKKRFLYNK